MYFLCCDGIKKKRNTESKDINLFFQMFSGGSKGTFRRKGGLTKTIFANNKDISTRLGQASRYHSVFQNHSNIYVNNIDVWEMAVNNSNAFHEKHVKAFHAPMLTYLQITTKVTRDQLV